MRIDRSRHVRINLSDDDIDAMREIIRLACDQLNKLPMLHQRGVPIPMQAGLIGGQLIAVREMIEEIGFAVEQTVSLPDLSIPKNSVSPLDKKDSLVEVK